MAVIGKIRGNLWLVVVLVGLAMAGFLLMEATGSSGSGNSVWSGGANAVGKVAGQNIDINDFNNKSQLRYGNVSADQFSIKNDLWNNMVNEAIVTSEAEKLGFTVTEEELESLVFGPNYSPLMARLVPNRQGQFGQPDTEQLSQIRDLKERGELRDPRGWDETELMVKADRLQTKLNNLVSQSIYTPSWMVNMKNRDNATANFKSVTIPFDNVTNAEVTLADADYKAYLDKNAAKYTTDVAQQTLDYLIFNVKPTTADSTAIKDGLNILKAKMQEDADVKILAESNNGSLDAAFAYEDAVDEAIRTAVFSDDLGTTYGPYIAEDAAGNEMYKVAKLVNRMVVPDSVTARHILIQIEPATEIGQNPLGAARDTAEVIKGILEKGEITFDSLALKYGTDGTKTIGGELGTFAQGRMFKPFSDLCFFEGKVGEIQIVQTQAGIHVVEVTERFTKSGKRGVQIAYINKDITPSKETIKEVKKQARTFATENRTLDAMRKAAKDKGMEVHKSVPVDENGFAISNGDAADNSANLEPGDMSRGIVKWANEAKVGEVAPTTYGFSDAARGYENRFVVAAVSSKQDAGLPSVESMKSVIGNLVMNEKKGEILKTQIAAMGGDLDAIAAKYEVEVKEQNTSLSGQGDAKLLSSVFGLNPGETSQPIIGNEGVSVAVLTSKTDAPAVSNIASSRSTMNNTSRGGVRGFMMNALRKSFDIKDKRNKFF